MPTTGNTILGGTLALATALAVFFAVPYFRDKLHAIWRRRQTMRAARNAIFLNRLRSFNRRCHAAFNAGHDAALYGIAVLTISIIAPSLFLFFDRSLHTIPAGFLRDAAANTLVAVASGFAVALFVSAMRNRRIALAENILTALAGNPPPNQGWKSQIISFEPKSRFGNTNTPTRHYNIINGTNNDAPEWVIALHQANGYYEGQYTVDFLKSQIAALEQRRIDIKQMNHRRHRESNAPAINWVCFVSKSGRFHAMQPYKTFCEQINDKENARYLTVLNASSEANFALAIAQDMELAKKRFDKREPVFYPDAIPDLECFWIDDMTSREHALKLMTDAGRTRAMIVSRPEAGRPLGVVTLAALAKDILYSALQKTELDTQPLFSGEDHTQAPNFTQ